MTRPYHYFLPIALLSGILLVFGCGRTPRSTTVVKTLDNGLTLVAEESRGGGVAAVAVYVGDGGLYETRETTGTAYLLSLLLFQETETHGPGEIWHTLEDMGGGLSSTVELDYVGYSFVVPADRIGETAELVADGLLHSVIDDGRFEEERERAAEEAAKAPGRQMDRAHRAALALYFGDHPYGRPPRGAPEVISSLTLEDLQARYRRAYVPGNMVISIAGDIDALAEIARLSGLFEGVEPGEAAEPAAGPVLEPLGTKDVLSGEGPLVPMVMAFPAPGAGDPYDVAMDVLLVAAGRSQGSLLHRALIDESELATAVEAGWYTRKQASPLFIWMTVPPASTDAAEARVVEILGAMADELISDEELAKSKALLDVGYDLDRERAGRMAWMNAYWVWVAGEDFWRDYRARLRGISAENVRAAAETYFASGRHTTGLVLPGWTQ